MSGKSRSLVTTGPPGLELAVLEREVPSGGPPPQPVTNILVQNFNFYSFTPTPVLCLCLRGRAEPGSLYCKECLHYGYVPLDTFEKLSEDRKTYFRPPCISYLCVECYSGKNIIFDDQGNVARLLCMWCRTHVSEKVGQFRCSCGGVKYIHANGHLAPLCADCHRGRVAEPRRRRHRR